MEGGRAPCLNECVAVQLIWGKRNPVRPGGQRKREREMEKHDREREIGRMKRGRGVLHGRTASRRLIWRPTRPRHPSFVHCDHTP